MGVPGMTLSRFSKFLAAASALAFVVSSTTELAFAQHRGGGGNYGYRYVAPVHYVHPYYAFHPWYSIGFGISVGYPFAWSYPYYYPAYNPYAYPYAYSYPYAAPYAPTATTPYPYPYGGTTYPTGGATTYPSQYPAGTTGSVNVQQQAPNQQNSGGISFEITPGTAELWIDGVRVSTVAQFTPTSQPLGLTAGRHRIEIKAPGYQTINIDADVVAGQVIPYQGTMQR